MKRLIGRVLDNGTRRVIVTACELAYVLTELQERVFMAEDWYTAEDLIKFIYTLLSGDPCGILERLEKGKWVA